MFLCSRCNAWRMLSTSKLWYRYGQRFRRVRFVNESFKASVLPMWHMADINNHFVSDCTREVRTEGMLRRHIVLLIAIRPSDGDVKPGSYLGAFREEQAMSRHRVSPSPFLSSSSRTTQHYRNSYNHPNLNFLPYTIQIGLLIPHVMWFAQAVRYSKIDHT